MAKSFNSGPARPLDDPKLSRALDSMPSMAQSEVTEDMTSAGRLDKMLGQNSPLMKRARTQGAQYSNSRGLLNSSMGAEASTGAMIDRAQPFAMQDSQSLIQNQQFNTGQKNELGLLQSGLIGDSYLSNQNYGQQLGLNEQAYGFESDLAKQQHGFNKDVNRQQFGFQTQRDKALAGYDRDMARLGQELQEAQSQNDFGRTQQLEEQRANLQSQRDEQLFGYDMQNTERQAELQSARDSRLAELDADSDRLAAELQEAQAQNDFGRTKELGDRQAEIQEKRDKLMFAQDMESMAEEYGLRGDLATQEAEARMNELFASTDANAWGLMSDNLTDIVGQYSSQIDAIQQNPNITPEAKTQMIEDQRKMRDIDIGFQQDLYKSLSGNLLNTGAFPASTQLTGMYQDILGREPDPGGMQYWQNQMNNGMSLNDIQQAMANSPEAQGA